MPSEDGLFRYESENEDFMKSYFMFWDDLDNAGDLIED